MFVCLFDGVYRHFQHYFSFIGGGNQKTTNLSQVTDKLYHIMLYTSPWSRIELTTLVVIGTDCICSCKSNYHTKTAMTTPNQILSEKDECFSNIHVNSINKCHKYCHYQNTDYSADYAQYRRLIENLILLYLPNLLFYDFLRSLQYTSW